MKIENLRIKGHKNIPTPDAISKEIPNDPSLGAFITDARARVADIVHKRDDRLLAIVGPCSIHDIKAAMEYATRLKTLAEKVKDDIYIVMRVYFEKPRTIIGWKGLINDPDLDGSLRIDKGVRMARKLLKDINLLGLPCGTEYLDAISPQYISDLVSWGAIGARTTESQVHRELASGLSCPIGFKNSTSGGIQVAADAVRSASKMHNFLSITKTGEIAQFTSTGNEDCHVILRGGGGKTNFDPESIASTTAILEKDGITQGIMVDFSHANSNKDHRKQKDVATSVADQLTKGNQNIVGIMLESHLNEGNQPLGPDLAYGVSITDACVDFSATEEILTCLYQAIRQRRG